jgi:hypothetical protein
MSDADLAPSDQLRDVWMLSFPLDVYLRAQEHADGLIREFSLIAQHRAAGNAVDVPTRLLSIVNELSARYGTANSEADAERDDAIERGQHSVDLHYRVPAAAASAISHLGAVFDEADNYCRAGRHLLSLATPPESLEFRRWFLGEFVGQIAGAPPKPWPAVQPNR